MGFPIYGSDGYEIRSLTEWFDHAPPASPKHWVPGRSAMELARRWIDGVMPPEVVQLLSAAPATADFVGRRGWAEKVTRFDDYGSGRRHDLVILGQSGDVPTLLAIEGKADETFGSTVKSALAGFDRRLARGLASNGQERIRALATSLFATPPWAQLPALSYQLLYAVAGTLREAENCNAERAVLIVHEFHSVECSARKLAANDRALADFVAALSGGSGTPLQPGRLVGPISIRDIDLYVGKAKVQL